MKIPKKKGKRTGKYFFKMKSPRVDYWAKCRNKLKPLFQEKGIISCELKLAGCLGDNFMGFAHKEKRVWYYSQPELLADFKQVVLACANCHQVLDNRSKTTKEESDNIFKRLRCT